MPSVFLEGDFLSPHLNSCEMFNFTVVLRKHISSEDSGEVKENFENLEHGFCAEWSQLGDSWEPL